MPSPLPMRYRKRFFLFFSLFLLVYSGTKFATESGVFVHGSHLGGDFLSAFPTFWAWKINRPMIEANRVVRAWMGEEFIRLDEGNCGPSSGYYWPLVCRPPNHLSGLVENKSWNYGPVLHFTTFPLLYLPTLSIAKEVWKNFCLLFFFASFAIWYYLIFIRTSHGSLFTFSLYSLLWLTFSPAHVALSGLEIETFEFFLLSLCFYFYYRQNHRSAGIALGFSAMTKFLPFGFLPYFLIKQKYRLAFFAVVTALLIAIVTEWTLGWDWSFTRRLMMPFGSGAVYSNTHSIASWSYRLFTHIESFQPVTLDQINIPPVLNPIAAANLTRVTLIFLALGFGWLLLKHYSKEVHQKEIVILFIYMMAFPQWTNKHYLIFLLPALSLVLSSLCFYAIKNNLRYKLALALFLIAALLTSYLRILPTSFLSLFMDVQSEKNWTIYGYLSLPVYGYIALLFSGLGVCGGEQNRLV